MRKRVISAACLICCLIAVGISAQAGKKDFYENQQSLADEEDAKFQYHELGEEQPNLAPISETNVDENAGHEYYELGEEQPNSGFIGDENTEHEYHELGEEQPNLAPISEINVDENAGHEYIEE